MGTQMCKRHWLVVLGLLASKASSKFLMLPMGGEEEVDNPDDDGADNLAQLAKTGQIPEALLKDIMAEAGHYMTLYNYNPSSFLKNQQLLPKKRSAEHPLRKKMTSGILALTRPRFGKRSRTSDFVSLTRPRFGKRSLHGPSYILKFLMAQDGKEKRVLENEDSSVNEDVRDVNTGKEKNSFIVLDEEAE